jgi:hypothetical protein
MPRARTSNDIDHVVPDPKPLNTSKNPPPPPKPLPKYIYTILDSYKASPLLLSLVYYVLL